MADKDTTKAGGNIALTEGQERLISISEGFVERLVSKFNHYLVDSRFVKTLLRDFSPAAIAAIYEGLPVATGLASAAISDNAFNSPIIAGLVKAAVRHWGIDLGNVLVETKGQPTMVDLDKVASEAIKKIEETQLVLDQMGFVHLPDCAKIMAWRAAQPKHTRKGKGGQTEVLPNQDLPTVTVKAALAQNLQAAPCCFQGIDTQLKQQTAPAPTNRSTRGMSFFDTVDLCPPKLQKAVHKWLETLPTQDCDRAIRAIKEVDSIGELRQLMALKPEKRLEMLMLFENRGSESLLNKVVSKVTKAAEAGLHQAGTALSEIKAGAMELDQSFKPMVEAQQAAIQARKERDSRLSRPKGFWGRLVAWFRGR